MFASHADPKRSTKNPETRPIKDVQLDLSQKYNFRIYTPLAAIPLQLVNAFVAAEEAPAAADVENAKRGQIDCIETEMLKLVYEQFRRKPSRTPGLVHPAILHLIRSLIDPELLSPQARRILFSSDGYRRRGNEQIIAFLVMKSKNMSVEQLSELSLNLPYLGAGSYGVTAAAVNYFSKPLDRLTLAEAAYLAGLPKSPNNYHPVRKTEKAVERRNRVIDRMLEHGFISKVEADIAKTEALKVTLQ